jgi:cytochrome d ubiquinol oxidase subunit II
MNVAAFILLAGMLAAYVMLDGYDLGVGAIHLIAARTDRERAASLAAIGPFWNGNEVMLIAAGASLFALFPKAYAASFSGFYLPFIVVLWLLMVRGMSIELRGHFQSDLWRGFWDVGFSVASAMLALFFGVAIGNIIRGVPLDGEGYFAGTFAFLLNAYALAVGVFALIALAMHGSAFMWMRTDGELAARVQAISRSLVFVVLGLFVAVTVATLFVHPISRNPALWIAPIIALASLVSVRFAKDGRSALTASSVFLLALMASAAETLFPSLLPGYPNGAPGLTIYNAAPGAYSIGTAFTTTVIGFGTALAYGTLAARRMLGRIQPSS